MKSIVARVFPKSFDNSYEGHKVALYVFYFLTAVTLWRSQHHLFSADGGAQSIATIPLDTFTESGAVTVVGLFALWGLSQLLIGFIYVVVCFRYRSMIPLMYLLMIVEYVARGTYIATFKPVVTAGTAPGATGNIPLVILTSVMFLLAVAEPEDKKELV